jgi:hypothetical protein
LCHRLASIPNLKSVSYKRTNARLLNAFWERTP